MVEQHPTPRTPGLTRALGVLSLLAGIVAMHAVVFAIGPGHAASNDFAATSSHHSAVSRTGQQLGELSGDSIANYVHERTGATSVVQDSHGGHTGADCAGDNCGAAHAGLHACVFILTAVAMALMLVLLYWIAADRTDRAGPIRRPRRSRRERAPPWTVLSLAELSILRI